MRKTKTCQASFLSQWECNSVVYARHRLVKRWIKLKDKYRFKQFSHEAACESYCHLDVSHCCRNPEEGQGAVGGRVALTHDLEGWRGVWGFAFVGLSHRRPTVHQMPFCPEMLCWLKDAGISCSESFRLVSAKSRPSVLVMPSSVFSSITHIPGKIMPINHAGITASGQPL